MNTSLYLFVVVTSIVLLVFLMIWRPPRSTRTGTLCPSTTLFRSGSERGPRTEGGTRSRGARPAGRRRRGIPRSCTHDRPAGPVDHRARCVDTRAPRARAAALDRNAAPAAPAGAGHRADRGGPAGGGSRYRCRVRMAWRARAPLARPAGIGTEWGRERGWASVLI